MSTRQNYTLNRNDFKLHLKEQIQFLDNSTKSFDKGFEGEAKRIAITIRVLLHDTNRSKSLLEHLKIKDMEFYDISLDYDNNNILPELTLIMERITREGAKYVPLLGDGPPAAYKKEKIKFEDWWHKIILSDKKGNKLSRKDLIRTVADQDGGSHVDSKLNKSYANLQKFNAVNCFFINNEGQKMEFDNAPAYASIRHIAYEVIRSLKDEFSELF